MQITKIRANVRIEPLPAGLVLVALVDIEPTLDVPSCKQSDLNAVDLAAQAKNRITDSTARAKNRRYRGPGPGQV